MENEVIDIFYIATGVYSSYFQPFLDSIGNFFPKYKKYIHIISDNMQKYDAIETENYRIDVHYQLNLPYPLMPLLKTYFIKEYITEDMKYIFYCDADTIFQEKDEKYWENLISIMESGGVLCAEHPGKLYPNYGIDENSAAFFRGGEYFFFPLISSFYGGSRKNMLTLCNRMNEKIKHDLNYHYNNHQCHYIPPLFDQDYLNRVVFESKDIDFHILPFVGVPWLNEQEHKEEECVTQKYDISRKMETKNML